MARISVIIPALNEEKYIGRTLLSVKKQKPFEIIVADSRSKDKTAEISKKHGARVVYAKKGVSAGRNAGGFAARGDLLLFLDADSIPCRDLLDIIKKDFSNSKIAGWTCRIYPIKGSRNEKITYEIFNRIAELMSKTKRPHAAGVAIAVRKNIFLLTKGFNKNLSVVEDHDFAMRISRYGAFKFSKKAFVLTSTRRLRKWGILGFIKKYSKLYINYCIKGRKNTGSYDAVR